MCTFRSSYFWKILSYSVLCRLQVLPEVQHGFELTVSRNFDTPLSQDQSMNPNRLSLAENELSKLSVFFKIWQASFRATAHKRLKNTENAYKMLILLPSSKHSFSAAIWSFTLKLRWLMGNIKKFYVMVQYHRDRTPGSDCTSCCFSLYGADSGLHKIACVSDQISRVWTVG